MANDLVTRTSATVCIPWRPQPSRIAAYERVRAFWSHHGFPIIEGDSGHEGFNAAASRNHAVYRSPSEHVIVADADCIPPIENIWRALETTHDAITYPYNEFRHIPAASVGCDDLMMTTPDRVYRNSVGGVFITRTDHYWELGGQDELFDKGWGYEDNAFAIVASTLSRIERIPGVLLSFNHDVDNGRDLTTNPHAARGRLYRMLDGNPEMMRELIRGGC